ncbi:hypothetical protein FKP32DRAFT_1599099 [Trametes sanguinea]|nr:hypothetical protein FKP32DRAFT_1599099 [Trametes sanguinea]
MHLSPASLIAASAAVLAALPSALAANCYSKGGCQQCESRASMESAKQAFCGSNDWNVPGGFGFDWFKGRVLLQGTFATSQECFDGFENIIEQCYGNKDGGTYDYSFNGHTAHLDVDFCNCE